MRGWQPPRKGNEPEVPGLDQLFQQLKVAKAWRLSPAAFRAQPVDDQAAMIAYEMFSDICESYRTAWLDAWRELTKDGKEGGVDGFDQMRAGMGLGRVLTLTEKIDRKLGVIPKDERSRR